MLLRAFNAEEKQCSDFVGGGAVRSGSESSHLDSASNFPQDLEKAPFLLDTHQLPEDKENNRANEMLPSLYQGVIESHRTSIPSSILQMEKLRPRDGKGLK